MYQWNTAMYLLLLVVANENDGIYSIGYFYRFRWTHSIKVGRVPFDIKVLWKNMQLKKATKPCFIFIKEKTSMESDEKLIVGQIFWKRQLKHYIDSK